jgi:hypothetical protein
MAQLHQTEKGEEVGHDDKENAEPRYRGHDNMRAQVMDAIMIYGQ